jgi:hypothetical protein
MKQEEWIQQVMNCTTGIQKVSPRDDLYAKIKDKLNVPIRVSPYKVWLVAASLFLLLVLNISALYSNSKNSQKTDTMKSSYIINQSNQLY